ADEFEQPASPRASIGLYEKVQTLTLFDARHEASINDLLECAGSVLMSRIRISPQSQYYENPDELLEKVIKEVTK
ncbi:MAG: hypothetical protein ACE5JO_12290, partial [Candidatus Binatia bacterium]